MTRQRNRTEQYLHERMQAIFAANPDPILFEVALAYLIEEVATACGLFVGEIRSAEKFSTWVGCFLDKVVDVRAGKPQQVRIGPDPVPKDDLPPAPPQDEQAETLPATAPEQALPVKPWVRGLNAGPLYMTGKQIMRHRKRLRMTQDALGEKFDMTGTCISHWETGRTLPSAQQYADLRAIFGLAPEGPVDD
jgi:DNA-binding XRE family transcriptional regulator